MEKVTKLNKTNGELLLGFRLQNKLTQTDIGNLVGKDKREVSKWEKGYRAIPQSIIDTLNKKYKIKLKKTGKLMRGEVRKTALQEFLSRFI